MSPEFLYAKLKKLSNGIFKKYKELSVSVCEVSFRDIRYFRHVVWNNSVLVGVTRMVHFTSDNTKCLFAASLFHLIFEIWKSVEYFPLKQDYLAILHLT